MGTSFDFRSLRCFPSARDAATWHFLPRYPDVQRATDGRPLVTLVDLGPTAYLVFTATWAASREDLQALREEIVARNPAMRAQPLVLAFAPVASPRCSVLVGDGRGSFEILASSATSGMPPYDAAFNLHLQGERLAHAKAALHGEPGRLGVEYAAQLRVPVSAKAEFRANGADILAAVDAAQGRDALRQALERAVDEGRARVVVDAPDPDASELATELYDRVLDRAAELLPRMLRQAPPGDVRVTAEIEREIGQPTSAFTDLGRLLATETTQSDIGGQHAAD
ncbi:MAG TPA: hypothetical protein VLS49_05870 [Usitatibacter sp.]|nr:hypothetical protein [Usitatibacter sp.]